MVLALLTGNAALAQEAPVDAEAEMAKGEEFLVSQQYKRAIAHFNAARMLAPDRPGPYLRLGMSYAADGNCPEAIPFLEEYLKRKKGAAKPEAVETLARCKSTVAKPPGRLTVTSDPIGAEIRVEVADAPVAGVTPFESTDLGPGKHKLYVSKIGYQPVAVEAEIAPGMLATLRVTLSPLAAAPPVAVSVEPARPPESKAPKRKRYWIAGVVLGAAAVVGIVVGVAVAASTPKDAAVPMSDLGNTQVRF